MRRYEEGEVGQEEVAGTRNVSAGNGAADCRATDRRARRRSARGRKAPVAAAKPLRQEERGFVAASISSVLCS